jgi:hypothetical protein
LSIVADNRILNTNINFEYELINNLMVIDIHGKTIEKDNFRVLSQNPLTFELNSNVRCGVYFLRVRSGLRIRTIKFLVL